MCLRTSTFVVKPMLLISTHWLLWRCDPLDLCSDRPSETQKATICVQVRCILPSYPLLCAQEESCDFLSCGQEDGEVAICAVTAALAPFQGTCAFVRMQCAISLEATGFRRKARGKQEQRRPLCRGLLRDGGEFDFPLVCMLV